MLDHLQKKLTNSNLLKQKSTNDVFKNMLILATGVGGAQLIGFALAPILTRIYAPEDFGALSVFMAATGLLLPFGTLRYSVSLPLPKQDGIAINLFVLSIMILLITTCILTFSLFLYTDTIFDMFFINSLLPYWWLMPVALFWSGLHEILDSWSIRQKNFKIISRTNIFQVLISGLVKIGLGVAEMKSLGLLIGTVFSNIFATALLAAGNIKSIKINIKYIRTKRMKFLLNRYAEYPKYRLPSQFILTLSKQAPLLFLAAFFGTGVVGYFGLSMMVIGIPLALFGNTTGQAYYAEVAKIGRKDPGVIYELSKDVIKRLFLFSIVPFFLLLFGAPWLFSIVFGDNWYEAGVYTRIMSFYMLAAFVSTPLANALNVFEEQLVFLKLNILRLIILMVLFFISWMIDLGATETIIFYSGMMSLYYMYLSHFILRTIRHKERIYNHDIKIKL